MVKAEHLCVPPYPVVKYVAGLLELCTVTRSRKQQFKMGPASAVLKHVQRGVLGNSVR